MVKIASNIRCMVKITSNIRRVCGIRHTRYITATHVSLLHLWPANLQVSHVPIFNTENHICGGRYEGIKSGNSFRPIGRVWIFLQGFL